MLSGQQATGKLSQERQGAVDKTGTAFVSGISLLEVVLMGALVRGVVEARRGELVMRYADHLLTAALLQQGVQQQPVLVICHSPAIVTLTCGVPHCSKRHLQQQFLLSDAHHACCERSFCSAPLIMLAVFSSCCSLARCSCQANCRLDLCKPTFSLQM